MTCISKKSYQHFFYDFNHAALYCKYLFQMPIEDSLMPFPRYRQSQKNNRILSC